jgi:hypothetical protein
MDADGERWLSLTDVLCSLAEASPEVFLKSIETSLQSTGVAVTRPLTETSEALALVCVVGMLTMRWKSWNPRRLLESALFWQRYHH